MTDSSTIGLEDVVSNIDVEPSSNDNESNNVLNVNDCQDNLASDNPVEENDAEFAKYDTGQNEPSLDEEDKQEKMDPDTAYAANESEKDPVENFELKEADTAIESINQDMETELPAAAYYHWRYEMKNTLPKYLITTIPAEFQQQGNKSAKFLKGCKWAPDGSCLLSCSDDDTLRLFNFPSCFAGTQDWTIDEEYSTGDGWSSELKVKEGGLIYDYCWYPLMSSMDPVSSCFISSSSEAPIHLWDAFTGKLRASYQPFNHLEQLEAAQSLAFDPTGESIYSGYEKKIRIFNIGRPGKTCVERPLKQPDSELNQYGIVSCICVNPALRSFYAVGTFDKTVGLYCDDGTIICILQGHLGGVTHMKFSSDGMKLYTGGRNDSRLFCWDMRKMGEAFKIFDRVVTTHQRIYFDITPDDSYLATGSTDGVVKIWDEKAEGTEPVCQFTANTDCVNGVSFNPYVPILATSSGQRHFYELASDSDDEMFVESESSRKRSCDIKLWKVT